MTEQNTTLATAAPATVQRDLVYMDQEARLAELFPIIKNVAPWTKGGGKNNRYEMTDLQIGLAIRKSMSMGVDPLNPYEVSIYLDKGVVVVNYHYSLISQWIRVFHPRHSEPRYTRMTPEQVEELGGGKGVGYFCRFVVLSDFDNIKQWEQVVGVEDAVKMFTVEGVGFATNQNWSSQYFAPNGRSKANKVKKWALTDAYRKRFGTPTPDQIIAIRRERKESDNYSPLGEAAMLAAPAAADLPTLAGPTLEAAEALYNGEAHHGRRGKNKLFLTALPTNPPPALQAEAEAEAQPAPAPDVANVEPEEAALANSLWPEEIHHTVPAPEARPNITPPAARPWAAEAVAEALNAAATAIADSANAELPITDATRGLFVGKCNACFTEAPDDGRKLASWYIFNTLEGSSKNMTSTQIRAWLNMYIAPATTEDKYPLQPYAAAEMQACARAGMLAAGQMSLLDNEEVNA